MCVLLVLSLVFPPWIYEPFRSEAYFRSLALPPGSPSPPGDDPLEYSTNELYAIRFAFAGGPPRDGHPAHIFVALEAIIVLCIIGGGLLAIWYWGDGRKH
jgi:hypothetical protein